MKAGLLFLCSLLVATTLCADEASDRFAQLLERSGPVIWAPAADTDWRKDWFLDGERGRVVPTAEGFELRAGPTPGANADHVVLWSQPEFSGDLRIDFDYTRLDTATRDVNILYLFARGSGTPPYVEDLATWADLRRAEPRMAWYFNHVATYHISFAAFGDKGHPGVDYVRARRYLPETKAYLSGTDFEPDAFATGLFRTGETYHFTVIRAGDDLFLRVAGDGRERLFHWSTAKHPRLEAGRIGLRHMAGRAARYENVVVRRLE